MDDGRTTPGAAVVRTLALAAFVSSYDRFSMAPLLLVVAAGLDSSPGTVAAVAGGYYLAYGLMQPLWGILADARGRVFAMRCGLAGGSAAGLASAVAPDIGVLAVTRGVAGGCFSAVIPCALVYIGDSWPAHVRQRPLSDVLAATSIGTTAGTLGTGLVAQLADWRVALATSPLVAAALAVATRLLPEPVRHADRRRPLHGLRRVLATGWARALLVLTFAEGVVVISPIPYLSAALQADGVGLGAAGAAAGTFGVGVLLGAQVVKRLVGRVADWWLIAYGGAAIAAGWAVVVVDRTVAGVVVTGLVVGAGWASFHSSMQNWATDVVPAARAAAVSLFVTALFAGAAVGAVVVAPLVDREAYGTVFALATALAAPVTAATACARRLAPGGGRWAAGSRSS